MLSRVLVSGLLLFVIVGCTISSPASLPTQVVPTPVVPTSTFVPTQIPTATLSQITLVVMDELVNCRVGPGTVYELLTELRQGQSTRVAGRNDTSTWWYVYDPGRPGQFCWISGNVTQINGDATALPVVQPPPAFVSKISLTVEPNRISVACSQFPQTFFFEAEITTDGPTVVSWQWEASTGAVSDIGDMVFEQAGTQIINDYYQVNGPNDYWVKLHILSPNELIEQANFRVTCEA